MVLLLHPFGHESTAFHISARNSKMRELIENSLGIHLRLIPPGTYLMGSPVDEVRRFNWESLHRVTLTRPFYLGTTPVTQSQYRAVTGINPSKFQSNITGRNTDDFPVESVSWLEATEFCSKLSDLPEEKSVSRTYRLPTEAEWEYACRAGTTTMFSFSDHTEYDDYCWCEEKRDSSPIPVASLKPNPWGLYDMHGNVYEFVSDYMAPHGTNDVIDPRGPETGTGRVCKGGGWHSLLFACRSAFRYQEPESYRGSANGFRILMEVQ